MIYPYNKSQSVKWGALRVITYFLATWTQYDPIYEVSVILHRNCYWRTTFRGFLLKYSACWRKWISRVSICMWIVLCTSELEHKLLTLRLGDLYLLWPTRCNLTKLWFNPILICTIPAKASVLHHIVSLIGLTHSNTVSKKVSSVKVSKTFDISSEGVLMLLINVFSFLLTMEWPSYKAWTEC